MTFTLFDKHSKTKRLYKFSPEAIVYFDIDCKFETFLFDIFP